MLVTDRNFAACAARVERSDNLIVDLETDGLVPWKGNRLCGIAVETGEGQPMYFSYRHEAGGNLSGTPGPLLNALAPRPDRVYGGWFLRYDLSMLSYEEHGEKFLHPRVKARDGIIAALLMNENEPSFSLESIASKYIDPAAAASKMSCK